MGFADFQEKQKQNKQKAVIRDFLAKRDGQFLCLTDDPTFASLLRATVKELAVSKPDLIVPIPDPTRALKIINDSITAGKNPALFIERVMAATGDTNLLIKQFRESFPQLRIFVLTTTADKGRIMLLHEAGADNFVIKPVSSVDLIEKMSTTLKPPSLVRQLLDKARSFVLSKGGKEAIKITQKVLEVKPDSASGYVVMGDALRVAGSNDKAQMAYERACKYNENYLEPLQKLVDLAKDTGDSGMQLEYLKRLDELSPMNNQRKVEIAELQISMGNVDAAKQLFDTALNRVYKDAMAQVAAMSEKIAMSLQEADPVQAEKYLRRSLELKGDDLTVDDLPTFNQLGISLRKQGRWKDAITEYKRALKIAPNSGELYYNIAMAHAEGKDDETANRCMLKALSLNSALPNSSAVVAFNMAQVFSYGITRDKALKCLEIALELRPDFEAARNLQQSLLESDKD